MDKETAKEQHESVANVIWGALEQAEEICADHGYPVNINGSAPGGGALDFNSKDGTWSATITLKVASARATKGHMVHYTYRRPGGIEKVRSRSKW